MKWLMQYEGPEGVSSLAVKSDSRGLAWEIWIPAIVFVLYAVHGSLLGLTDDEAYYWVLAQHPSLGYAFHPPAVAWSIWLLQKLAEGLGLAQVLGSPHTFLVRLPAAFYASAVLFLALKWMKSAGVLPSRLWKGALILLSFIGFFSASWMMVPDLPLFFGWTLAFISTWELCFGEERVSRYIGLGFGLTLAMLSKYSGVLALASAGVALLLWSRPRVLMRGLAVIGLSAGIAAAPVLVWNMRHDWASLLYQLRDRHGDFKFSGIRYVRFWIVQLLIAGPPLLGYFLFLPKRSFFCQTRELTQVARYILAWTLPGALVFCLQPAWSDFKLHWAFVVWFPIALELGWAWGKSDKYDRVASWQCTYGLFFGILILGVCHVPFIPWIGEKITGRSFDPRLDVSNDMYGWSMLRSYVQTSGLRGLPVVGSRYQTASQAAFALSGVSQATLIPRDLKQLDEWPDLKISKGQGPEWPELVASVLFVSDNRYGARPEFKNARCIQIQRIDEKRLGYLAKQVDVWKCEPQGS